MFLCFEWTLFLILSAHCNEIQFLVVPTPAQGVNLLRNRLLSLLSQTCPPIGRSSLQVQLGQL